MRNESGRSMIEMMGVLAIMGIITAAAITAISFAMRNVKRSNVQEEVMRIVSGVRDQHAGFDDFSGLDNARIWGAIGMENKNPYGGNYVLNVSPQNPRQFVVSITGLSGSDCEYFITKAWSDSVEYTLSNGRRSGAIGTCSDENGKNTVSIIYGE